LGSPGFAQADSARGWNAEAAARYLDGRAAAWKAHPKTQRSQETACISCHTGLPYLLARPELRGILGEATPPPPETALVEDVLKRSGIWDQVEPWYAHTTDKVLESKGTEAVLNALVLAVRDRGRGATSPLTREALGHMWKQQHTEGPTTGGWSWLDFGLAPWETKQSEVWGACLAALAVAAAPGYASEAEAREPRALLEGYLRRRASEPLNLHSRLGLLWVASVWPDLLPREETATFAAEARSVQRSDGGFSLQQLGRWERQDASPPAEGSDGYATGLVTFVFLRLGDPTLGPATLRGLAWLRSHQDREGFWDASSANLGRKDDDAFVRFFMRDAASGYAVLALSEAEAQDTRSK
jgi:squalene-hopene/tetraprenyl-beta-curcumene cyclase